MQAARGFSPLHGPGSARLRFGIWSLWCSIAVAGCGGGGSAASNEGTLGTAPPPQVTVLNLEEDTVYQGTVATSAPAGSVTYRITGGTTRGAVVMTESTGAFSYTPSRNFVGTDSFSFSASPVDGNTVNGTVSLIVAGVNDSPVIAQIANTRNSPDTYEVVLTLVIDDADGDDLTAAASVDDQSVADARVDVTARTLTLRPKGYGATRVQVDVADGFATTSSSFTFTVGDVARHLQVNASAPSTRAIVLANPGPSDTDFELTHNGKHAFGSLDQILEAVRGLPNEIPGEAFERKLWRFVRDNTYHYPPASGAGWMDGTWATLNSFGWGFCSNVTSVFIQLAEAAGLEARAWGLGGHVVPEINVGGSWQVYDPDIAVYYYRRDAGIASLADLAAEPALITAPSEPVFAPGTTAYASAYDPLIGQIYGTTDDNHLANWYPSREPFHGSRITLPAGGRLVYPGRWTSDPVAYDGATPYPVEQFRQARLEIPAGRTGSLPIPWVLWDVQGTGTVRILGQDYGAGTPELTALLAGTNSPITAVEIIENSGGMALIMMINPLWYDVFPANDLIVTGKDAWAINPGVVTLPIENRAPPPVPDSLRKPQA